MKKRILSMICAVSMLCSLNIFSTVADPVYAQETVSTGTTYYISSIDGNNQNSGTSENSAWETLDMLGKVVLKSGDKVLLESGSVFNGFIHMKNVSGTASAPIMIDQYGTGAKPVINAKGQGIWYQDYVQAMDNSGHRSKGYVSSAILLYDCDFVEIRNLEITNEITDPAQEWNRFDDKTDERMDRTGVAGIAKNGGTMDHIYLENLYIHDVDGNLEDKHMNNGGVQFNALKPDDESATGIARFNDFKMKGCYVKDVSRAGVCLGYTYNHAKFNGSVLADEVVGKYGHTNILFEDNYIQNPGNDALVVMYSLRPMVQRNVSDAAGSDLDDNYAGYWQSFSATIWPWKCKDAIFQYNEAFDTVGTGNGDGQAWDVDWSDGTIFQYNYSHNNGGGAFLICLNEAYRGTFRYNISQNDLKALITFQGNPNAKIYNNVFYVDGDRATRINHPDAGKSSGSGELYNNIFYNTSTANPNDAWAGSGGTKVYSNNLYFGYTSTPSGDAAAVKADPKFVDPGKAPTDATGLVDSASAFSGYKIQNDSPAINKGKYIANSGSKDFFGNAVGLVPDIGVHETTVADPAVAGVFSDVYTIGTNEITGVRKSVTADAFKAGFKHSAGVSLNVLSNGTEIAGTDLVTHGMVLRVNESGTVKEYTIRFDAGATTYTYTMGSNSVSGVVKNTTVDNFLSAFEHADGVTLSVYNGTEQVTGSVSVTSGMVLKVSGNGSVADYTISVIPVRVEYPVTGMTATAGSIQPDAEAAKALDQNAGSLWHTNWNGCTMDQRWITIDMGSAKKVSMLKYVPRTTQLNGVITGYEIYVSTDGTNFTKVTTANSTWALDNTEKYTYFDETVSRYVKLKATSTSGDYASAAEIRLGYTEDPVVLGVSSDVYTITTSEIMSKNSVSDVVKNTTVENFLANFTCADGVVLSVYNGTEQVTGSAAVTSGMVLKVSENGSVVNYTINVTPARVEYPVAGMTATVGSAQTGSATEGNGSLTLDDNLGTMWHTAWAGCQRQDCWITIDMGKEQTVSMLKYVPRTSSKNGLITKYEIYVSTDGTNFTKVSTKNNIWADDNQVKYAEFDAVNARYVKLFGAETATLEAGKIFASAAEIRLGYTE